MGRLRQNLTVSLRRLRRSPGFTIAAIVTLALGIGANTTIFTAVNAVIFRPLPVERPNELVFLNLHAGKNEYPTQSYPNYLDFRDRNNVLSGLISYRIVPVSFSRSGGTNARLWGYLVTGNYFDVLGVSALRGRILHPEDDRKRGGHPVAVISYAAWQRRLAGDPDAIGKTVKLNGLDYTIVGVMPQGFTGTETIYTPEIWVPMAMQLQIEPGNDWIDERRSANTFVLGRLKPGVTKPQAEAALNAIAVELGREYPQANEGIRIVLSPPGLIGTYARGAILGFATVLMGVAGMVLLITCVNLASLLLARASDRRKETAIRLALGASRGQLVRQLLTESVVLSVAGGAAGLLLATWLSSLFAAWRPPVDIPVFPVLHADTRVMVFAAVASLLTGLLFGLAPALQSTRASLSSALKSEALIEKLRRFHLRDALVAAQVALSVVLLIGSVLVVRSLQHALSLNLGFEPRHAASVAFDLALQGYQESRALAFERRLLDNVRGLAGVESAGMIDGLPLTLAINNSTIFIEGKPIPRAADVPSAAIYRVSPGYLHTVRTKLLAGRDFDERDEQGPRRAIVNQTFARQLLPGEDPLGKRFRFGATSQDWNEIVGVVEDGKYRSLGEQPMPTVFRPLLRSAGLQTELVARSSMPEAELVGLLRRAVHELDPALPIYEAASLTDRLGLALFPARIAAIVLSAFGFLAVLLASTGVYGIMAYAVSRRTREIGIRMALGAAPFQVLRVVLGHTAILLVIGAAAGVGLALSAGRFFSLILYGVSATDPTTYALAIALIALVALAACWFPARRAISIDPVTALRTE